MSLNVKLIQTTPEDTEILTKLFKAAFHADFGLYGPLSHNGGLIGYNSVKSQLWYMKVFDYLKILYQNQIIGGLLFNSRKKGHFILK